MQGRNFVGERGNGYGVHRMQRLLLGILALVFLTAGVAGLSVYGTSDSDVSAAASVALRAGVLLAAWWLALPQLSQLMRRFPPWMWGCMALAAVVLVWRPRLLIYLIPLFGLLALLRFAGWLLQPLPTRRSTSQQASASTRGSGRPSERPKEDSTNLKS